MLADRLLFGEALGARCAHVVGLDVVEQQGALQEVDLGVADENERQCGQSHVLQDVDEDREETLDALTGGARDVEHANADQVVEADREQDDARDLQRRSGCST